MTINQQNQPCPFFRLPLELRHQVYKKVLAGRDLHINYPPDHGPLKITYCTHGVLRYDHQRPDPHKPIPLSFLSGPWCEVCRCRPTIIHSTRFRLDLLLISKQIHLECKDMVFKSNTFCFETIRSLLDFFGDLASRDVWRHQLLQLKSMRFGIDVHGVDPWLLRIVVAGIIVNCPNLKSLSLNCKDSVRSGLIALWNFDYDDDDERALDPLESVKQMLWPLCALALEDVTVNSGGSSLESASGMSDDEVDRFREILVAQLLSTPSSQDLQAIMKRSERTWREWINGQ